MSHVRNLTHRSSRRGALRDKEKTHPLTGPSQACPRLEVYSFKDFQNNEARGDGFEFEYAEEVSTIGAIP